MSNVTRAIFPGVLLGCLLILFVSGMTPTPQIVFASTGLALDLKPLKLKVNPLHPAVPLESAQSEQQPATSASGNTAQSQPAGQFSEGSLNPHPDQPSAEDTSTSQPAGQAVQDTPQSSNQAASDASPSKPVAKVAGKTSAALSNSPKQQSSTNGTGCSLSPGFSASVRQWCSSIDKYARENNLDPNLIAAVITQESGGQPQAYSSSGAVGLMQIMPSDGISAGFMCVSGPCFSGRPTSSALENPDYNISYGTRMLAGLVQRDGSIREALRAYGPMNVGYSYADLILSIYNSHK
jgi:hypothetical protein